ncbi:MAG: hypothetical protein AAB343_01045 [Patescibacteria group bacterium]
MNQKGEYILAGITTLLIAVAGVAFFNSALRGNDASGGAAVSASDAESPKGSNDETAVLGMVKVTIDFGNGTNIEEERDISAPLDARDIVYLAAATHEYRVQVGEKFLPIALGDVANEEDGKRWTLYINGARVSSLEHVFVASGDVLMLKYE